MLRLVRPDGWAAALKALVLLALMLVAWPAFAAPTFPPLTGRVVDAANLFTPEQRAQFDAKLAAVEQTTGRQFVVATIPDLQGYPLEDYGYQLGRAWGIGAKDKNNGVVMFVAPNNPPGQRGPRIEVGYGLEPIITDAFASSVVMGVMTPMLKAGDTVGAFNKGIDLVAAQMQLTPEEAAQRTAELQTSTRKASKSGGGIPFIVLIFIVFFVIIPIFRSMGGRRYRGSSGIGDVILWSVINGALNNRSSGGSSWSSGGGSDWGGGGGGGGGFSGGGGGSFGGGGASGGW